MDEKRTNVIVAEAFLKKITTREKNKRIVNSQITVVEAKALEEEKKAVKSRQTRSKTSATTARGTVISVMNVIVDHKVE